mmetsp:Transcript_17530/g.51303  ORF Transcript_17530/g.51303 Transcript_17530/m.51303 type:complete len:317 (-) Transcript_17530:480-1430(-)
MTSRCSGLPTESHPALRQAHVSSTKRVSGRDKEAAVSPMQAAHQVWWLFKAPATVLRTLMAWVCRMSCSPKLPSNWTCDPRKKRPRPPYLLLPRCPRPPLPLPEPEPRRHRTPNQTTGRSRSEGECPAKLLQLRWLHQSRAPKCQHSQSPPNRQHQRSLRFPHRNNLHPRRWWRLLLPGPHHLLLSHKGPGTPFPSCLQHHPLLALICRIGRSTCLHKSSIRCLTWIRTLLQPFRGGSSRTSRRLTVCSSTTLAETHSGGRNVYDISVVASFAMGDRKLSDARALKRETERNRIIMHTVDVNGDLHHRTGRSQPDV